jgi:hypothetical protein
MINNTIKIILFALVALLIAYYLSGCRIVESGDNKPQSETGSTTGNNGGPHRVYDNE